MANKIHRQMGINATPPTNTTAYGDLVVSKDGTLGVINENNAYKKVGGGNGYTTDKIAELSINSFEGLDSFSKIVNFRHENNKTIKKRCGYQHIVKLNNDIRSMWSGEISGIFYVFAISGSSILKIDIINKTSTPVGTVSNTSGQALFFIYENELYVFDGATYFVFYNNTWQKSDGYAPQLYNKASMYAAPAPNAYLEQVNMFTPCVRCDYTANGTYSDLKLNFMVKSVEIISVGSKVLTSDEYSVNNRSSSNDCIISFVNKPGTNYTISIACTMQQPSATIQQIMLFDKSDLNRLFCIFNNDKTLLYYNQAITSSQLLGSQSKYPNTYKLYMPSNNYYKVSNDTVGIKSMIQQDNKLLVCTKHSISEITIFKLKSGVIQNNLNLTGTSTGTFTGGIILDEKTDSELSIISSNIGCENLGDIQSIKNKFITNSKNGIYIWELIDISSNQYEIKLISEPIKKLHGIDYLHSAIFFINQNRDELWVSNPMKYPGCYIYNFVQDNWVYFDGFSPTGFFDYNNDVGFYSGRDIFIFNETLLTDKPTQASSSNITAILQSNFIDFLNPSEKKDLSKISLSLEGTGGQINMLTQTNHGGECSLNCIIDNKEFPQTFTTNDTSMLNSFNYMRFKITSNDAFRPTIKNITATLK